MPFRYSMCNETFDGWKFADACKALRKAGYSGIELAPFTLHEDPARLTPGERREFRRVMQSEGLEFVGLHWLMASPKGLHATTPDAATRALSWTHVRNLIDLCADLGPNGLVVFGSPAQRRSTGGLTRAEATRHFVDGLAAVAPHAAARGVTVLLEPLPIGQCDVVQTLEEAVGIVRQVASPGLSSMFDVHNAIDEAEPHERLVERFFEWIRHVHVNELDGRRCGAGSYHFKPLLEVLRRLNYPGWISLEVFDSSQSPEQTGLDSLTYLRSVAPAV